MQQPKFEIELLSWQILKDVPSASGIVKFKDGFYVIGDDSPYLFHLDNNFKLLSKIEIYSSEKLQESIIPKFYKPDFEAMEMISETEILVFGSGSKSPERDVCVLVKIGKKTTYKTYDISSFFSYLRNLELMQTYELDIEGLAIKDDIWFLFNRGLNIIFSFPLKDFTAYCETGTNFPIPKTKLFSLPEIEGQEAGFSGATSFHEKPYFVFTAAVEDAPNAYDDGDIMGSFLGVLKLENGEINDEILILQIPNPGYPLKIESVIIDKIVSNSQTDLVLITDNDGKASEILRVQMTFNIT